jgi:hypothetical protein
MRNKGLTIFEFMAIMAILAICAASFYDCRRQHQRGPLTGDNEPNKIMEDLRSRAFGAIRYDRFTILSTTTGGGFLIILDKDVPDFPSSTTNYFTKALKELEEQGWEVRMRLPMDERLDRKVIAIWAVKRK